MTKPLNTSETRKRGQKISPSEIDKLVGMRIRIARNMSGMKQEDIANYLGLTLQQTQKYENGKNKISVNILLKIAQYFNIPISYFIPHTLGTHEENLHNTIAVLGQQNLHHRVAEDWKPIGHGKNSDDKQTKKILLEIMEALTTISDVDKQKQVLQFIKTLQKE